MSDRLFYTLVIALCVALSPAIMFGWLMFYALVNFDHLAALSLLFLAGVEADILWTADRKRFPWIDAVLLTTTIR